eukprot:gnl/Spiro4/12390_TR6541_c0_g1_i1.p1 gnl/Spiro4/12390_TR6541_c0_g1~~gnl/Spiro4/12390_TR6541_c0_g1_i1.p1  ORF type:complete len:184 (-),score=25.24 gnl/Spiro4/12390_TR6541_c0_g1_i1:96-617(-)
MMTIDDFKALGNAAYAGSRFLEAIDHYTEGIKAVQDYRDHSPSSQASLHILYSNRSAAYSQTRNFERALEDANECVRLAPDFLKGHSRRSVALSGLGRTAEALEANEKAKGSTASTPQPRSLESLDPETRRVVENMMNQQRSGGFGRTPAQEEMLKKFMTSHPEMDFSQAKFS